MYSVVLLAALSGGTANPAWCHRWACHGCHACRGCHWCGCSGWCGCGCGGCGHGYCSHFGAYPPIGAGYSFCDFCGCYGCYGCYGNGGFHGNAYGCWCGCFNSTGCYCGHSCWGVPAGTVVPPPPPPQGKDKNGGKKEEEARLIITVPEEAKLYIDGQLMKSASGRRVFTTPALRPGQQYFYDLKAEVIRDGQTVSRTQRVYLRVGDVITASFDELNRPAATARSEESD